MATIPTCRSCGAALEWAKTTTGANMPLDLGPYADGNLVVVNGVARAPTPEDAGRERRRSHYASCPQGAAWRRKKA
jgi:hypothetical protein